MTADSPAEPTPEREPDAGATPPASEPGAGEPGAAGRPGVHRRPRRYRLALVAVAVAVAVGAGAVAVAQPWSGSEAGHPGTAPTESAGGPTDPAPPFDAGDPRGEPPGRRPAERAGFPDADTTGVSDGVELARSGGITVTEDGTLLENLLVVDGTIDVYANDVTIRNVRVTNERSEVQWGISQNEGAAGLVVEDSEIFGSADAPQFASGIGNHGGTLTVRRVEVHSISDGIVTRHGLLEDNYLHSPRLFPDDHTDMIQANGGPAEGLSLEIRNNTVINDLDQTAAVFLQGFTGHETIPVHNVLLEGNYLAGGGYTIYGGGMVADGDDPANIVIRNNVFGRDIYPDAGRYGPSAYFDEGAPGNEWSGNIWEGDGAEVILGPQT